MDLSGLVEGLGRPGGVGGGVLGLVPSKRAADEARRDGAQPQRSGERVARGHLDPNKFRLRPLTRLTLTRETRE